MSKARQLEISSMGGRAAHEKGTAHEWKRGAEAQAAGRNGGLASGKSKAKARAEA